MVSQEKSLLWAPLLWWQRYRETRKQQKVQVRQTSKHRDLHLRALQMQNILCDSTKFKWLRWATAVRFWNVLICNVTSMLILPRKLSDLHSFTWLLLRSKKRTNKCVCFWNCQAFSVAVTTARTRRQPWTPDSFCVNTTLAFYQTL